MTTARPVSICRGSIPLLGTDSFFWHIYLTKHPFVSFSGLEKETVVKKFLEMLEILTGGSSRKKALPIGRNYLEKKIVFEKFSSDPVIHAYQCPSSFSPNSLIWQACLGDCLFICYSGITEGEVVGNLIEMVKGLGLSLDENYFVNHPS